ncbi:MAG TPA: hydrogenase [Candidatus Woesearchaeota archaeon]|nr:hydrogenase [Candidatus Woesearchaeota archaeon]
MVKKTEKKSRKIRVGVQSITGCAGCQLSLYFVEDALLELLDKIDLVAAPMIKGRNEEEDYDVLFVEGSVSSKDDLDNLLRWRKKTKLLIALGACASHGCMQSMKHVMNQEEVERAVYNKFPSDKRLKPITDVPIHKYVKVDFYIPGCPPSKEEIVQVLKLLVQGVQPRVYDKPVCHECSLKENYCLLDQGIECLGPLVNGGCRALCPSYNHPCTGCRGFLDDANLESGKQLLRDKGFDPDMIIKRMTKYNTLQFLEFETRGKKSNEEGEGRG